MSQPLLHVAAVPQGTGDRGWFSVAATQSQGGRCSLESCCWGRRGAEERRAAGGWTWGPQLDQVLARGEGSSVKPAEKLLRWRLFCRWAQPLVTGALGVGILKACLYFVSC